jgi:hypothetical protein
VKYDMTLNVLDGCARRHGEKAQEELEEMERRLRCLIVNTVVDPFQYYSQRQHILSKFHRLQSLIFIYEGYSNVNVWLRNSWYQDQAIQSIFNEEKLPRKLVDSIDKLKRQWKALGIETTDFPEVLIGDNVEDGKFVLHTYNVTKILFIYFI